MPEVEKTLGLIPTVYYDIIARIIPGMAFVVALLWRGQYAKRMLAESRHGFTLIELSIVLVIIGLIIGGVLAGREMIQAAEVRATVGQVEKYNTAVNTFFNKYNCLPGDCAQTLNFGLGTSGGPGDNGNGDGFICNSTGVANINGSECGNFWYHLAQA